jgi:Translation elongation factors (GTPases)
MPEPLLAFAITPKTKGDEDKLSTALSRLREEDPTLRIERSDETHETVMYGMGEAHLDVQIERMKRKFGVEVTTSPAKIAYRETVRGPGKGSDVTSSRPVATVSTRSATSRSSRSREAGGSSSSTRSSAARSPNTFIGSVEKGVVKTMQTGVMSGNPMVDIRCTLVDGKFHSVDSSDMAFQLAGALGLKEAAAAAGVVLLEPIVEVDVVVPESHTGDIMGDLNSKRAKIQGVESAAPASSASRRRAAGEVARYSIDLRSMTGGRAAFTMHFSHYEEVPSHLADKIIAAAQQEKEAAHK